MRPRPSTMAALLVSVLTFALAGCASSADGQAATAARDRGTATTMPPWPAPTKNVSALATEAGLNLGPMGTAEHYHPTLRVVANGEAILVPPNIGVDPSTGAMSAVHTHESDGTIHIEAQTVDEEFTLGQFFTQWNVALGTNRIGGVESKDGILMTVNGRPVSGDPAQLRLRPDQEIILEAS